MIDNRAGLTISTKAIGAAEQNWMLEVSDGGRNSITSESDNFFTNISGTLLKFHDYNGLPHLIKMIYSLAINKVCCINTS